MNDLSPPGPQAVPAEAPHLEDLTERIRPRAASNLLLWLILGFVALFVIWASLAELDRTVHAPGRVIVSGRLQVVSNLEGGVVQQILVKGGDQVKQGQPLILLDPTASGSELGAASATVDALSAKVARLEAEIAGRNPVYPAAGNAEVAEQIRIERALHAARLADLASLTSQASARSAQAQRAVAEARAAYQSRLAARDSAQSQLAMIRPLVERGIEPRVTLVQLESQAAIAGSDAMQAQAAIARAQGAVAEANASIMQVRQNWRAQAGNDLATAQAERAARSSAMPALSERLKRQTVVSPVSGRINRVLVATVGSATSPGQPLIEVVPGADTLTVEAMVNPKDIAAIRIGQHARVNVSAFDSAIYGALEGKVSTISPDATVDERTGESHYTVRVEVDAANYRDSTGRKLQIGPGMTADVNLIGDKRSVMSYLLTPFTRLSERALRE